MHEPTILLLEYENSAVVSVRKLFNENEKRIIPVRTVERLFDRLTQNPNAFIIISTFHLPSPEGEKIEKLISTLIEVKLLFPFSFPVILCEASWESIFKEAGAGFVLHNNWNLAPLKEIYQKHCRSTLKSNQTRLDEIVDDLPFK